MKRKSRRLIAAAIACMMTIGYLAGCSGKKQDAAENLPGAETDRDAEKNKTEKIGGIENSNTGEEPVTIEWLAYTCYGKPDPDAEVIKRMEEKFNVKFKFWYVDDQNWEEVLNTKIAGGDMPDIMRIKNNSNIPTYVKQGILAEISDDILTKIPSYTASTKAYDPDGTSFIDTYYDGKCYALKSVNANGIYPTVLTWRKDWLENVGIDKIPTTLEEYEKAMYAFTNDDPDGNGIKDTFGMSNTTMNAVFGAYGAIPLKEFRGTGTQNLFFTMLDGKVAFAAVQPEMKEALRTLQKWYRDGVIDPEFITGENKSGYWAVSQDFENGKVGVTGMAMSSHWRPPFEGEKAGGSVYESFMAVNPEAKWGETIDIGAPFTGPEGKSGTHCWGAYGSNGIGITTKCLEDPRKVEAVCAIIETMCSDFDMFVLGKYGIEGEHYYIDENGRYVSNEQYASPTEGNKVGLNVISYLYNGDFDKKADSATFEFMDQYKSAGYMNVLVPQTEAADQYLTDLKTFTLDAYIKIITGEEEIDYFDDFVEEFNATGGQQIVDEINEYMGY